MARVIKKTLKIKIESDNYIYYLNKNVSEIFKRKRPNICYSR